MAQRWPLIDPGELRTPVLIQAYLPTSPPTYNSAGQVSTWQTVLGGGVNGYFFARIEPMRANDVIRAGLNVSEVEIPITMRYHALVTASCRIVTYLGAIQNVYIIKGVVNRDERNVLCTWSCVALNANQ